MDDDRDLLATFLPPEQRDSASRHGALKGLRKHKSAENLLHMLLPHVGCGHSLRETAVRAKKAGLGDFSAVSLMKRLKKSGNRLQALCAALFRERWACACGRWRVSGSGLRCDDGEGAGQDRFFMAHPLLFDRSLRGTNVVSRVLGVGHILFDIALDEARGLPECIAALDGLSAPLLIVSVEDEVTGTGASVHRMVFGVMERDGPDIALRDWELLQLLNSLSARIPAELRQAANTSEAVSIVKRLTRFIEPELTKHAPTMVRPMAWPELLLLPRSPDR